MREGNTDVQVMQRAGKRQGIWVRQVEHLVLRLVSLAFSLASAHAIRWFFAPLDGVDVLQPAITWIIAIGFGVLGYFVSRGLAHRLMNKERVRAYLPICLVVEIVEIFCNYALAAAVIQRATWLAAIPVAQHQALTFFTYVVLSIVPLVSVLLAVVDMDLERSKLGVAGMSASYVAPPGKNGASAFGPSLFSKPAVQPKAAPTSNGGGAPPFNLAPTPTYAQGYQSPAMKGAASNGTAAAPPFSPVQVQTP